MSTLSKASLDSRALAMMSNTYFFELKNPLHPLLKTIGNARVVCVEIHESDSPALGLSCPDDEHIHMYSIHELSFSSALPLAV